MLVYHLHVPWYVGTYLVYTVVSWYMSGVSFSVPWYISLVYLVCNICIPWYVGTYLVYHPSVPWYIGTYLVYHLCVPWYVSLVYLVCWYISGISPPCTMVH